MLGVEPAPEAGSMKTDVQIQQDVIEELRWDDRVDVTDIGVEVSRGVVTLTGTVDRYAKKLAAVDAAHRVAGVRDVANEIEIHDARAPGKSDTEIAQAVRETLAWDTLVPADRIHSTVSHGWVRLEGRVSRWRDRIEAGEAVRRLAGVRGVTNEIAVAPERPADPAAIHRAIERALERRADREADRIAVHVDDGCVTLTGTVRTWPEKRALVGTASHAPGVREVIDHLRVDPNE
jgi:osmotically-inducible protein OsmY